MPIHIRCRDKRGSSMQWNDGSRVVASGRLDAMASHADGKPIFPELTRVDIITVLRGG